MRSLKTAPLAARRSSFTPAPKFARSKRAWLSALRAAVVDKSLPRWASSFAVLSSSSAATGRVLTPSGKKELLLGGPPLARSLPLPAPLPQPAACLTTPQQPQLTHITPPPPSPAVPMGATLASLPTAVWAQFLSGDSGNGGGVDLAQQQQQPQQPSRASSDAFHQCCGSPPPLAQHWEAAAHEMDYPSAHPRYLIGPPPPALIPSNSGSSNLVGGLSNNQWATNSVEPGHHSGLLQGEQQHQYSDYQEPFTPHIMPTNAHVNHLQHEFLEESREAKRSGALSLGHAEETSSSDAYKRPRLDQAAAASVPFKAQVRKEKLGERITALQQLVSPFGKTDTASVLLEAIGYIKFLQDQVQVLSTPYMKPNLSSGSISHHDSRDLHGKMSGWPSAKVKIADDVRQDLRSRGLCLVPVSCTLQVANDNGADFWTPAIGGSCR